MTPAARKLIFDAAKRRGAVFTTKAHVADLDQAIDQATPPVDEGRLAAALRSIWGPLSQRDWDTVRAALHPDAKAGLCPSDFEAAANRLGCSVAQIRAVDEVEGGSGWFTDVRADILALDGPGGFIDGDLPKILFEAHIFARHTDGRFNASHPNLSSPKWNKALYIGGLAEWERLHRAMLLDEHAALMSASVGRYQIMGFNHKLAGYGTVAAFWDAMKRNECDQLNAFVTFIINSGLADELRAISREAKTCEGFAAGYNGTGQVKTYAAKIAAAFQKWSCA